MVIINTTMIELMLSVCISKRMNIYESPFKYCLVFLGCHLPLCTEITLQSLCLAPLYKFPDKDSNQQLWINKFLINLTFAKNILQYFLFCFKTGLDG